MHFNFFLPATAVVLPSLSSTKTVISDMVWPGVGIILTKSFITYSSPITKTPIRNNFYFFMCLKQVN